MDARVVPGRAAVQGTVRIRNISALPALLAESGVALEETLAKAGLEQDVFANPDQVISYRVGGRLLQICADATGVEDFGLRLGMRQSASVLGLAGYVGANAPTVREALETIIAALKLSDTGGSVSLVAEGDFASLRWTVLDRDAPAIDHIDDAAIAVACNIMRGLCGSAWSPAEVCLARKRPKSAGVYVKFFNAPLRFEAEAASLTFEARLLEMTVSGRDPLLHQILSPILAQALEDADSGFREKLCEILRAQILSGPLTPDRAAAALGISARTLARRLADENATFSELAQSVRFEVAQRLLRAGKSLSDIAATLGYSDSTAFIRAFKQITGVTPARWRRGI